MSKNNTEESFKKRVSVDFDLSIDTDRKMFEFLVKMGGKTAAVKFAVSLLMNNFYNNLGQPTVATIKERVPKEDLNIKPEISEIKKRTSMIDPAFCKLKSKK